MAEIKNKEEYEKMKTDKKEKKEQTASVNPTTAIKDKSNPVRKKSSLIKLFIFVGISLLVLIPAVTYGWYYMTHGNITGNVYVTMQSGDIKRASGVDIYVHPDAQHVLDEIKKIKHDSEIALAEINKEKADILKAVEPLLKDAEYSFEVYKQYKALFYNSKNGEYDRLASQSYEKFLEQSKLLAQFRTKLDELDNKILMIPSEHNGKIVKLLYYGKNTTKGQTNVDGFYSFQGLKRGKYLLFARYKVFDNKLSWLTTAEIKEKDNKLDLTINNATDEIYIDEK